MEAKQGTEEMIWEIHEQESVIEGLDDAGRPDPAYAAALGLVRAPFGRRVAAVVIDVALWTVLQLPLWLGALPLLLKFATGVISPYGLVNHPSFVLAIVAAAVTVALSLVCVIVQLVLHGRRGVTIGKMITGIRTVNVRTLERPGVGAVLLRLLIVAASGIVPIVGSAAVLLSPLFDSERRGRGWHDQATKVWLVDVRAGLHPYDEKRMRIARKTVKAEPLPERSELPSLATPLDPAVQPEYRPGSRISAGVLGVARPPEPHDRTGASPASSSAPLSQQPVRGVPGALASDGAPGQAAFAPLAPPAPPVAPATVAPQPVAPATVSPQPVAPQPVVPQPVASPQVAPLPQPVATPAQPVAPASAPAAPHPQPVAPHARFALRLDTGEDIDLTGPVMLGRAPEPAGRTEARPVPIPDPSRSLSKTHLLARPVDGGLEVTDVHSTNGSALVRGGTEYPLPAGTPVTVVEGDRIRLGDRTADVIRA